MSKESSLLENDDLPKMHIKMRGLSTPTPIGTGPPPFSVPGGIGGDGGGICCGGGEGRAGTGGVPEGREGD